MIDELGAVCQMLESMPLMGELAMLVREVDSRAAEERPDAMAALARRRWGWDVDAVVMRSTDTIDVSELPNAMTALARWRLRRVEQVLQWARGREGRGE